MKRELYINGKDAYVTWGISLDNQSLSALMTPPPVKDFIKNESRLSHGEVVIPVNPKVGPRDVTLTLNMVAYSESQFFYNYSSFCEELSTGILEISTSYQPNVLYKFTYISCNQFTQFVRQIAKLSLKLREPNPNDREVK